MNVKDIVKNFFSTYPSQTYKKREVLIHAGTTPKGIFYLKEGIIREYWISGKGEELTLNLYKPGTFLPMSWAVSNVPVTHFFEAMVDCTVQKAPKEDVLQFLQEQPAVVYDLLRRLYIGIGGLWMHLESITAGSSYTKLIASLVILGKRFGKVENNNTVVQLSLHEQDLANYAGMSRETANRELQKLRKDNLVEFTKGKVIIFDLPRLESLLHA